MSSLTRALYSPTPSMNKFTTPVPVAKGGTGGMDVVQAVENLGGIPLSKAGQPNGWPALGVDLKLDISVFPIESQGGPTIRGPLSLLTDQMGVFTITNYDSEHTYVLTATQGFVSRDGDTIYYRAPATTGVYGFTIDDKAVNVTISSVSLTQPAILTPTDTQAKLAATVLPEVLYASDRAATDYFNTIALSADGQKLAIGAHSKDVGSTANAGQVYVYTRSGNTWVQQSIIVASDKVANDSFGISVAFDGLGNRLVIGAYRKTVSAIVEAGQVYIYILNGNTWQLESTLSASDKATSDLFGNAVALDESGTRLAVGAPSRNPSAIVDAGQVYIYTRVGSTWTLETTLTASDKAANDYFGEAVSINADGSRLAIGAYNKTVSSIAGAGKVYIFTRSGVTWTEGVSITAYDKAASDNFGVSVALSPSGTRLAVGSWFKTINSTIQAGKVYTYVLLDGAWSLELELTSPNKRDNEWFGFRLALTDTTLCIGAAQADSEDVLNCGGVYTYDLSYESASVVRQRSIVDFTSSAFGLSGTVVAQEIVHNETTYGDLFGFSVAIGNNGNLLAVGARKRTVSGIVSAGKVYLYNRVGSSWVYSAELTASDKATNDQYGSSIAISANGDRIIVGAFTKDVSGITDCGQVYIYVLSGGVWVEESVLSGSDRATSDQFGYAVAIDASGTRLAVGAYNKTVSAIAGAGKVYLYTRSGSAWILETTLTASVITASMYFGTGLAFNTDATLLAVGAAGKTFGGTTACGTVTFYTRVGSTWTIGSEIAASDKQTNAQFGVCLAFDSTNTRLAVGANLHDSSVASNIGKVYVFRYVNNAWVQDNAFVNNSNIPAEQWGNSVAFSFDGTRIIIGAPNNGSLATLYAGAGKVYDVVNSEHEGSDWQIATDPAFTNVVSSVTNSYTSRTTWQVTDLVKATDYYVRVRYKGTVLGYSDWSPVVKLTTRDQYLPSIEIGTLTAYDKAAQDQFGASVALSSDGLRLAVGASNKTVAGLASAGKVYVYTRSGISWVLETELTASDKAAGDNFGASVSFDGIGSRLAVSAHAKDVSAADNGKVYIYTRSGTTWSEETTILAADRAVNDYFGVCVCLDYAGSRIAIGAHGRDVSGTADAGQIYIYTRSGSVWSLETTLTAYDRAASDYFGVCAGFDDSSSRLAVGAFNKLVSGVSGAGKVYVYARSGTSWSLEAELSASDKENFDNYGIDLALDTTGTRLMVGANGKNVSGLADAGKVYMYTRVGSVWTEQLTVLASDKAATDQFGAAIGLANDASLMTVGAFSRDVSGLANAGQVYFFK